MKITNKKIMHSQDSKIFFSLALVTPVSFSDDQKKVPFISLSNLKNIIYWQLPYTFFGIEAATNQSMKAIIDSVDTDNGMSINGMICKNSKQIFFKNLI